MSVDLRAELRAAIGEWDPAAGTYRGPYRFADGIGAVMERLPARFIEPVKRHYLAVYRADGFRAANVWLRGTVEAALAGARLNHAGDDDRIRAEAARRARECRRLSYARAVMYARAQHVDAPAADGDKGMTEAGALARMADERWWRRALRRRDGRAVERLGRDLNLIHRHAQCYATDEAVYRRAGQRARTALLLAAMTATNEDGQAYTVADLAALGVSNPAIRRGELMTRIRGCEEYATSCGHVAEFITLSAPSRMHRARAKSGQPIAQWDGSTPRDVQQYFAALWARARAALARDGIEYYGFRIAEPHHDGTPHWHLLLFVSVWQADRLADTIRDYALADSPHEPGARKHRVRRETIDPERGSAAAYVAKYVAKNIDGHGMADDLFGNPADIAARRIDAWASTWGIRQFQQIGGPRVTAWRELRRVREAIDGALERYRLAADLGEWVSFMRAWASRPLKLMKTITGEVNRYGELAAPVIEGVTDGIAALRTRWHVWRIEFFQSGAPPPWTCVNNCTAG